MHAGISHPTSRMHRLHTCILCISAPQQSAPDTPLRTLARTCPDKPATPRPSLPWWGAAPHLSHAVIRPGQSCQGLQTHQVVIMVQRVVLQLVQRNLNLNTQHTQHTRHQQQAAGGRGSTQCKAMWCKHQLSHKPWSSIRHSSVPEPAGSSDCRAAPADNLLQEVQVPEDTDWSSTLQTAIMMQPPATVTGKCVAVCAAVCSSRAAASAALSPVVS